jgi:hypothetical protein
MTVQELRNMGFKVKVLHNRLYKGKFKWQTSDNSKISGPIDPDTKGGSTHLIIDSPTGSHYEGIALCSRNDNYDKKLGVRIALGRSGVTT